MECEIKAKEIMVRGSKGNIQLDKRAKEGAERRMDEKSKPIISPCEVYEGWRCFLLFT